MEELEEEAVGSLGATYSVYGGCVWAVGQPCYDGRFVQFIMFLIRPHIYTSFKNESSCEALKS